MTRVYLYTFIVLILLLGLTVAAAFVDIDRYLPGHGWSLVLAMTIAIAKGLLIILYFMHVKYGKKLTWAIASAGFLWLAILFALILSDYLTRNHPPGANPKGEPTYLSS